MNMAWVSDRRGRKVVGGIGGGVLWVAAGCFVAADSSGGEASGAIDVSAGGGAEGTSGQDSGWPPVSTSAGVSDAGDPVDECSNVLRDAGFEGGTPNDVWDEGSQAYGSPICSGHCSDDHRAGPRSGDWWVWFGGFETADVAYVSQTVAIPEGAHTMSFWLALGGAQGTLGDDVFTVEVDDTVVFRMDDGAAEVPDRGYRQYTIDIAPFADGGQHEIRFAAAITGEGLTNFFLDDVHLAYCEPAGDDGTGGSGPVTGSNGDTSGPPPLEGSDGGVETTGSIGTSGFDGGSSGGGSEPGSTSTIGGGTSGDAEGTSGSGPADGSTGAGASTGGMGTGTGEAASEIP